MRVVVDKPRVEHRAQLVDAVGEEEAAVLGGDPRLLQRQDRTVQVNQHARL
jgi:hypothetical protein